VFIFQLLCQEILTVKFLKMYAMDCCWN